MPGRFVPNSKATKNRIAGSSQQRGVLRSSNPLRRARVGAALLALLPLAACGDDPDPSTTVAAASTPGAAGVPVVLDYSPTVSDAGALLYLAAHPGVDLLAVTLPSTGEADCEPGARITRSLLAIAGRDDVPVGCGEPVPADGRNAWPAEWRADANHLPGVVLPGVPDEAPRDAEQLLTEVLDDTEEPVTIVAVGPLTNLALLLADEPAMIHQIERVVTMGGAVHVAGNVEAAPRAEWNYHVDPAATRDVLASGVDVLVVPLDATDDLPWTSSLVSRIGASVHPVARVEHQIVSSRPSLDGIFLWDELAAVAALEPSVVTTESITLSVAPDGSLIVSPDGAPVTVAVAADIDATTTELLRVLNGGEPLAFDDLTGDEAAYFESFATTMTELADAFEALPPPPPSATPRELARLLVETFWTALGRVGAELEALEPPATIATAHTAFADAVAGALSIEDQLLDATDQAEGDDPWMMFDTALREIDADLPARLLDSCRDLEEYAIVRGGPELCGLLGD